MTGILAGWIAGAVLAIAASAFAQSDDLKPFPAPEAGVQRFVIRLPVVRDPDNHKVEVVVGKTIEVDCNKYSFSTTVTRKVAQGWGFPYYVVGQLKGPIGTRMACPPDFVNRSEFVGAHAGELDWQRYNPRLPIVVYAPAGTVVRYRVWSASDTAAEASAE